MHRSVIIVFALLILGSQAGNNDWAKWLNGVVDNGDVQMIADLLEVYGVADEYALKQKGIDYLTSIGIALGDAARIMQKAQGGSSVKRNLSASKNKKVTLKLKMPAKQVFKTTKKITVPKKRSISSNTFARRTTFRKRQETTDETTTTDAQPVEVVAVDWKAWLDGVVDPADVDSVSTIMTDHRLDEATLSKLNADGLESIGILKSDALAIVAKNDLKLWLQGIVLDGDIPDVIKICLKNRIDLAALQKLEIVDIAATGIALGDATRIYDKAHQIADSAVTPGSNLDADADAAAEATNDTTATSATVPVIVNIVLNGDDADLAALLGATVTAATVTADAPAETSTETVPESTEETSTETAAAPDTTTTVTTKRKRVNAKGSPKKFSGARKAAIHSKALDVLNKLRNRALLAKHQKAKVPKVARRVVSL